jgi:hypothetical protein
MRRARATLLDRYYTGASTDALRFVHPAGNDATWRAERRYLRILPGSLQQVARSPSEPELLHAVERVSLFINIIVLQQSYSVPV